MLALIMLSGCTSAGKTEESAVTESTTIETLTTEISAEETLPKIDTVLSANEVDINGTAFTVKVEMVGGTKEFGTIGYDETDIYKGDFYIVSYDNMGKKLSEYKLENYINDYELYFTTLFDLEIFDYNNDNNPDFTIGQRWTNNFSLHKIYSINKDGIISTLKCCSGEEIGFNTVIPVEGDIPSVLLKNEGSQSFSTTWYSSTGLPEGYLDEATTEKWFETHPFIDWVRDYYQWNGDSFTRVESIPVDINF